MITAVSLNPSIDRTIELNGFTYGGMNRVVSARDDAGGKAVNMAVTVARLGYPVTCIGVNYRENGSLLQGKLMNSNVASDFLVRDGAMRVNLKLLDTTRGVVTEVNAAGEPLSQEEIEEITRLIARHAQKTQYLVLTGSLPPGCPKDFYKTIVEKTAGTDCRCVVDAEGEGLHAALSARPFLIKPNKREIEMETGYKVESVEDAKKAALWLIDRGIARVAVSMGAQGALLTDGSETFFADPVRVRVGSTVGAGDAMVAGMVAGLTRGLSLSEVLRLGAACATAGVMTKGTEPAQKAAVEDMLDQISIRKV